MSVPRIFAAFTATLALLTAVGCASTGSVPTPAVLERGRAIVIAGHGQTFTFHMPVPGKSHADVAASSPNH